MKNLLPLTLLTTLLLAACTTHTPPAAAPTGPLLEGEVQLGTTVSGQSSPYADADAIGQTLSLHAIVPPAPTPQGNLTPQAVPVSDRPLAQTTVQKDLWYRLALPSTVTIPAGAAGALQGPPPEQEGCEVSYRLTGEARTLIGHLRVNFGGADEDLTLSRPVRITADPQTRTISAMLYDLVYADADVREQSRMACVHEDVVVSRTEFTADLDLKRGWNIVRTEYRQELGPDREITLQRVTTTDDFTHHLVLAR